MLSNFSFPTKIVFGPGAVRELATNLTEAAVSRPLVDLPYEELCPGSDALATLMEEYR